MDSSWEILFADSMNHQPHGLPDEHDVGKVVTTSSESNPPLEELVDSLAALNNPELQYSAVRAIESLTKKEDDHFKNEIITDWPGLVGGLVSLLDKRGKAADWDSDGRIRSISARTLYNLAHVSGQKIGNHPGAVERLVGLLAEGENLEPQKAAALALSTLAWDSNSKTKICNVPGALDGLVRLMCCSPDVEVRERAAATLAFVSEKPENREKIVTQPGAFEGYVDTLGAKEVPNLQYFGAYALAYVLHVPEYSEKFARSPRALFNVVSLLGGKCRKVPSWTDDVRVRAAWIIELLAAAHEDNIWRIATISGALEALVRGLEVTEGNSSELQKSILKTMVYLSRSTEIGLMIAKVPGSVLGLVGLLPPEAANDEVRWRAANVLANLAGAEETKPMITELPGALDILRRTLAEEKQKSVRDQVSLNLHKFNELTEIPPPKLQVSLQKPKVDLKSTFMKGLSSLDAISKSLWALVLPVLQATILQPPESIVVRPVSSIHASSQETEKNIASEKRPTTAICMNCLQQSHIPRTTVQGNREASFSAGKNTNKHISRSSDSSVDLGDLVKLLSDDAYPDRQYAAAKDLQERAKVNYKPTRKAIADCPGVVQTLVRLLEGNGRHENWDADGRLRSSSTWTLSHLATASGSRIVNEPQAVERLITLLDVDGPGGGIPDVRKAAVFALHTLAWDERCKVLICTTDGAFEKLLRLMKDDPDEPVREKATATIAFSSEKAQYQGRIARHPGVFEGLVEALSDREGFTPAYSELQYFAAYALANLVRVSPYEDRVANTADALQSLVTLLGANRRGPSWTDDVRVRVAWIFYLMAKKELNLMKIAKHSGALEALVKALEDAVDDPLQLHSPILATVVYLAKNPEIRVMIANVPGCFTNLKNQLLEGKINPSGERKTRLRAACALSLLAEINEIKLEINRMPVVFDYINRVLQEGGKLAEYDRFNKLTLRQVLI